MGRFTAMFAMVLVLGVVFILAIYREGYHDGQAVGKRIGYEHGRETGYSDGLAAGYASGRRAGEQVGYREGYTDAKWGRRNRGEDAEWLMIDENRDRPKAIAMEIAAIFAIPFLCYCLAGLFLAQPFLDSRRISRRMRRANKNGMRPWPPHSPANS